MCVGTTEIFCVMTPLALEFEGIKTCLNFVYKSVELIQAWQRREGNPIARENGELSGLEVEAITENMIGLQMFTYFQICCLPPTKAVKHVYL